MRADVPVTATLLQLTGSALTIFRLLASISRGPCLPAVNVGVTLDRRARNDVLRGFVAVMVIGFALVPDSLLGDLTMRFRSIYEWQIGFSSLYRMNMLRSLANAFPDIWKSSSFTFHFGLLLVVHAVDRCRFFYDLSFQTDSDVIDLMLLGGTPLVLLAIWMRCALASRLRWDGAAAADSLGIRRVVFARNHRGPAR